MVTVQHWDQKTRGAAERCDAPSPPPQTPAYLACAGVAGTLSGAVGVHQKQPLRRSDVRVSALLCELSPDVPRTVD